MAAEGGEDPGIYRYNTHADWTEDIAILTLSVIGQNFSLAKWSTCAVIFVVSSVIETKFSPVKHSSCCFNYSDN